MELKEFIDKVLGNVISRDGLEKLDTIIKEEMKLCGYNYDTTKVECEMLVKCNNYKPRVEISSNDCNSVDDKVIFIDYYLD